MLRQCDGLVMISHIFIAKFIAYNLQSYEVVQLMIVHKQPTKIDKVDY